MCRCSIRDYCDLEDLFSVYHQCSVASLEGRSVVVFAVAFIIVVRVGGVRAARRFRLSRLPQLRLHLADFAVELIVVPKKPAVPAIVAIFNAKRNVAVEALERRIHSPAIADTMPAVAACAMAARMLAGGAFVSHLFCRNEI